MKFMKDNSCTETSISQNNKEFTVSRQVDLAIENKIDRHAFQQAARLIELPKIITDLDFVFITLICQANDEGKTEIWEHEGGAYVSLMLPYDFVVGHSQDAVLRKFLEQYEGLIMSVEEIPPISVL